MSDEMTLEERVKAVAVMYADIGVESPRVFTGLSCGEIDALAALFQAVDEPEAAEVVLDVHSLDDDEGDSHWERRQEAEEEWGPLPDEAFD